MKVIHREPWNEWHNTTCIGYAILAAQKAELTAEQIKNLVLKLYEVQMNASKLQPPAEAQKAFFTWLDRSANDYNRNESKRRSR